MSILLIDRLGDEWDMEDEQTCTRRCDGQRFTFEQVVRECGRWDNINQEYTVTAVPNRPAKSDQSPFRNHSER